MKKRVAWMRRFFQDRHKLGMVLIILAGVCIVGTFSFFITYHSAISELEQTSRRMYRNNLSDAMQIVEANIRYFDSVANMISSDENVKSLLHTRYFTEIDKYRRISQLTRQTRNLVNSNSLLDSIYVYLKPEEKVVYQTLSDTENIVDVSGLKNDPALLSTGAIFRTDDAIISRLYQESPRDLLKITRPIPSEANSGFTVVNVSVGELTELLSRFVLDNHLILVLDREREPLLEYNPQGLPMGPIQEAVTNPETGALTIDGTQYQVIRSHSSPYTGWTYLSLLPESALAEKHRSIYLSAVFALIATVLTGLALGALILLYAGKPMKRLLDGIPGNSGEGSTEEKITALLGTYTDLIQNNTSLNQYISVSLPMLQERFYVSLLFNHYESREAIHSAMGHARVTFSAPRFMVCLFAINMGYLDSVDARYITAYATQAFLSNSLSELCDYYLVQLEADVVAVILNAEENLQPRDVQEVMNRIVDSHRQLMVLDINVGISEQVERPEDLHDAYRQASDALDSIAFMGEKNTVITYSEISIASPTGQVYPFHIENKLIAVVKTGEMSLVDAAMEELGAYLQENRNYSFSMLRHIYLYLSSNIKKSFLELSADETALEEMDSLPAKELTAPGIAGEIQDNLRLLAEFICGQVNQKRAGKKNDLFDTAVRYIGEHYSEGITVEDIASHTHISVPYLYLLFREHDQTPANFLNTVRVDAAVKLLVETRMLIKDIGVSCGFESLQAFYRQFKKGTGLSPKKYRESHTA